VQTGHGQQDVFRMRLTSIGQTSPARSARRVKLASETLRGVIR
jgi:hypothetical protein